MTMAMMARTMKEIDDAVDGAALRPPPVDDNTVVEPVDDDDLVPVLVLVLVPVLELLTVPVLLPPVVADEPVEPVDALADDEYRSTQPAVGAAPTCGQ